MSLYYSKDDIKIFHGDILTIKDIPEESVGLTVTSPPYNLDIEYKSHNDSMDYEDWLEFNRAWIKKVYALTKESGRLCLNVPVSVNRPEKRPIFADILNKISGIGWQFQTIIFWHKGYEHRPHYLGTNDATAPFVFPPVEAIIVLNKGEWQKPPGKSSITLEEYRAIRSGLWTIQGQKKNKVEKHPAPFPVELPTNCIKLFSYTDDIILDPFLGSGTTLVAALNENRTAIGVEIEQDYCKIAVNRTNRLL